MALSGVHIVFSFVAAPGPGGQGTTQLLRPAASSQTMTNAGTSTITAPASTIETGQPVASIRPTSDVFVSIGKNPDASVDPRRFVPANTDLDVFCNPGDRVAWVAA